MLKYGIALIICVSLTYVQCQELHKETIEAAVTECKTKVGATDEDAKALLKQESVDSSEFKCLLACVLKNLGIMNADGKLESESNKKIIQFLGNNDAKRTAAATEVISECSNIELSDDHCESAAKYQNCIKKQAEEKDLELLEI